MNGPGTVNNRTQVQVPLDQNETIYLEQQNPNVYNVALAILRTGSALLVNKFLGGVPNQLLRVKSEGTVTITNNAGGMGSILTNTGANKVLDANRIYNFTYTNDVWVEEADSQGSGGVSNFLTINDSNAGAASPAAFDGLAPVTISANTVGAPSLSGSYVNPAWIDSLDGAKITGSVANAIDAVNALNVPWAGVSGTPTTIAGYGITDFNSLGDARWVLLTGSYADPSWITSLAYSKITGVPPSRSESDSMLLMGG